MPLSHLCCCQQMADTDCWKIRSDEEDADDLFFEEEGNEESKLNKKEAQDKMANEGMLLVAGPEWKEKLKEKLIEAYTTEAAPVTDWETVFENVERAGKATCCVRRKTNSKDRQNKAKKVIGGTGTGFLMSPKSELFGWLVITNNHVIMDEDEAKSAEVVFDHLDDDSLAKTKRIKVKELVSKDIRTKSSEDLSSLDFSVLALESGDEDESYLEERASIIIDETDRVNSYSSANKPFLRLLGLQFTPIIAFSHAHGLGKRLSIGKYPDKCEKRPIAHIKHELPTARGSSGANLIYPSSGRFDHWSAAFLHYRHNNAVAWQAIGPLIRNDLNT